MILLSATDGSWTPRRCTTNATYAKGTLPTSGIPYVLVNGTIVVKDSKVLKDVNPGQPIRFEPQDKSRFEPLRVDAWKHIYTVSAVEFGGTEPFGEHGLACC